jgi:DNA processing protein
VTPDPAWVALSLIGNLGARTMRALGAAFNGDYAAAIHAPEARLRSVRGIGPKIAHAIRTVDLAATAAAIQRWQAHGVAILTLDDRAYPAPLRALDDAPPTLFVRGTLPAFTQAAAVVGTRHPSAPAQAIAARLAAELAARGQVIVSGLALGIDAAAHLGALSVPQGQTVAVLGSGLLDPYPAENRALADAIAARGALICEARPDARANPQRLVARNRIITGLSQTVIVVETAEDGGAMHAARFARAQGRALYAVDFPVSGNRALIADGVPALSPEDPVSPVLPTPRS